MSTAKIFNDLRKSANITKIRIARDAGEDTAETRKFCKAHLHAMVNYVNNKVVNDERVLKFKDILAKIESVPGLLLKVSKFQDVYEEVLMWNKMIHDKKLDMSATVRHREVDSALVSNIWKACNSIEGFDSGTMAMYMYNYAHRNY